MSAEDLPKGLTKKGNTYYIDVKFKDLRWRFTEHSKESGLEKLRVVRNEVEELKTQAKDLHLETDIQRNKNGIASVPITNKTGKVVAYATVCDEDWHMCTLYSWYLSENGECRGLVDGQNTSLHRFIMKPEKGKIIQHIDKDKSNNKRDNLMITTCSTRNHMRAKNKNATSDYYGVYYATSDKVWRSQITKDGREYIIGSFPTEVEAAKAYNEKAEELYGEFAKLNIIS